MLMTEIPGAEPRPAGALPPLYVVIPILSGDICDTMARVAHGAFIAWACPHCLVAHNDLHDPDKDAPPRNSLAVRDALTRLYATANSDSPLAKAAAALLLTYGHRDDILRPAYRRVRPSYNIPWSHDLSYGDYASYEMLHGMLVGIFKHLQRCLFDALSAEANRALAANFANMAFAYSDGVSVFAGFDHASDLKTLAQRFADDVINARDLGTALAEMVVEDFVEQNPLPGQGPGRDGLADVLGAMFAGFADLHWELRDALAEGDRVMSERVAQELRARVPPIGPTGR
jgi:hypothetical protein